MADRSAIEWTDATWNPIRARNLKTGKVGWHCEHATTGCEFCYAEGFNKRLGTGLPFKPGHRNDIELFLDEGMLTQPLRWKKPRTIFVCSMTDLFADFVPDAWIERMLAVMDVTPQHTYQVLTKRAARMRQVIGDPELPARLLIEQGRWPLPNVWLGVSAERQQEADERIPLLLQTPAAIRFISAEPLLGSINLDRIHEHGEFPEGAAWASWESCLNGKRFDMWAGDDEDPMQPGHPKLDWVIAGGESGPNARPMHPDWPRVLRDQCAAAGVAFFFKQWGAWREPVGEEHYDTSQGRNGKPPAFIVSLDGTVHCFGRNGDDDRPVMIKVDKAIAGRHLDGKLHNAMPARGAAR
jgi:protein gp37